MNVVVFGSGGFLGRRLCERLSRSSRMRVTGLSSSRPGGIDALTGLLPDDFALPAGTNAVVYLAQSPHYRRLPEMQAHVFNVNVLSAVRAASAAREADARTFIYASTGSVYAPSFAPLAESSPVRRDRWYPLSKLHAEEALALAAADLHLTVLRPFCIYGPGQRGMLVSRLIDSVASGRPVTLECDADGFAREGLRTSLCFVDDAAQAIQTLLDRDDAPPTLNLASPESATIRRVADTIGRIVDRAPMFERLAGRRESDLLADTTLLESVADIGFTPLESGLRATIAGNAAPVAA